MCMWQSKNLTDKSAEEENRRKEKKQLGTMKQSVIQCTAFNSAARYKSSHKIA